MQRRHGEFRFVEALAFGEGNAVLVEVTEIDEIGEPKVTAVSPALKRTEGATDCLSQLEDAVMCGLLEHPFYPGFGERWEIDSWSSDSGNGGQRVRGGTPQGEGPTGGKEISDAMLWGTA